MLLDVQATQAETIRLARYGREVRGTLLASAYEIEWTLDQVLLGAFFPGQENPPTEQRTLFDDWLLKRGPLTIANKIKLLSELRKVIPKLAELVPEALIEDLHSVRNYRNEFAHYPVVLHPDGEEPVTKLRAVLAASEKDIELNDTVVKEMFDVFTRTTNALNDVVKALNEGALKVSSNPTVVTDAQQAARGTP